VTHKLHRCNIESFEVLYFLGNAAKGGYEMKEENVRKESKLSQVFLGIVVIALGLMIIFVPAMMSNFWLLFIWLPGIIMEYNAIKNRIDGLLVPGGVLLVVGLALTLGVVFPGFYDSGGWGLFVLAPAFGLFQLYLAGGKGRSPLLIPVAILAVVGVVALIPSSFSQWAMIVVGAVLIVFGLLVLFRRK